MLSFGGGADRSQAGGAASEPALQRSRSLLNARFPRPVQYVRKNCKSANGSPVPPGFATFEIGAGDALVYSLPSPGTPTEQTVLS